MVARLQIKASQIGKILQTLENKSHEASNASLADSDSRKNSTTQQQRPLGHYKNKSGDFGPPIKKPHYIDPIPPFNANKIRKSPLGTESITVLPQTPIQQPTHIKEDFIGADVTIE